MTFAIRMAGADDAPAILGLIEALAVYEKEPDAVEATEESLRRDLQGETHARIECLLAEVDREVVGMALFFHNYSTWKGRPGIYLEDLFVLPEYRSQGIGLGLMRHLARIAVERKCARFEWACLNWNEPAISFYESLGAVAQEEWTVHRLTGGALTRLAEGS